MTKITVDRAVLEQALWALGFSCPAPNMMNKHKAAEDSLRAALAEQEEPEQDAELAAAQQAPGSKNCMQCAAAYMLGVPLADVPDFEKAGAGAWESFEAFFSERGFTAELFPPSVEILGDYLAIGDTERGTSHMVVMRGGKLLHDPHPSNAGLTSIQALWLIVRRAGPQPTHPAPQRTPLRTITYVCPVCAASLERQE